MAEHDDGTVTRQLRTPPVLQRPAFEWHPSDAAVSPSGGGGSGKKKSTSKKPPEAPRSRLTDLFECICVLVAHGARLDLKDRSEATPLDLVPTNSLYRFTRWALRLGLSKMRARAWAISQLLQTGLARSLGVRPVPVAPGSAAAATHAAAAAEPGRVGVLHVRGTPAWAEAQDTLGKLQKRANGFRIGGISNNFNSAAKQAAKATEKAVTVQVASLASAAASPRAAMQSLRLDARAASGRASMSVVTTGAGVNEKERHKAEKHARREEKLRGRESDADSDGGGNGNGHAAATAVSAGDPDDCEPMVTGDAGDMVACVVRLTLSYLAQDKYEAGSKLPSKLPPTMLQPLMGPL
jgi:hypothetical protein